jgi:NAD(P)-dependent dehydrogenase (short-subunit alcohol dehydrogenase family)
MQFDLSGKVAIVTGATKGLGRAMAHGLAAAGASVVISSRKQDLCEAVAGQIAADTGSATLGLACHVGDWDAIPAFAERVVERFGTVDVLVNNAGINPAGVSVADMSLDLWRKVLSVNLEGPLRMSQVVAPVMRAGGGGSIINVASMGAYQAGRGTAAYAAAKAALLSLTRVCAAEWASWGIRVNAISPGPMMSEMAMAAERNAPGWIERAASATMLRRAGESHEIAGPVCYLASDASSFVTGEDHLVSGGMLR